MPQALSAQLADLGPAVPGRVEVRLARPGRIVGCPRERRRGFFGK